MENSKNYVIDPKLVEISVDMFASGYFATMQATGHNIIMLTGIGKNADIKLFLRNAEPVFQVRQKFGLIFKTVPYTTNWQPNYKYNKISWWSK